MRLGFPCKRFVKHCRIVDASAALTDDSIRPSPSLTPPRSPKPPLAGIVRHCLFAAAFANSSAAFANIFAVSFDDSTCEDREASSLRRHGRFLWQRLRCLSFSQNIKFSKYGRHLLSRDYMTLKLWDINMDSGPVATFQVHEYLRPKLCDLYENDSIFDKFECCLSGDGLRIATGSYSNLFRVFGCAPGSTEATTLEACKNPMRRQVQTPARPARSLSSLTRAVRRGPESPGVDATYDFTSKLLHLAWHPTENSIACAAANSLYMYYA